MGRLLHSVIASLDGYTVDAAGGFDWAMPSAEVEQALTEQMRDVGTYLYGRRMYETMAVWDDDAALARAGVSSPDFTATWRAADKVVYSASLESVWTSRTRLERRFDPEAVGAAVRAADHDVSVEGATLASSALRAGLVDLVDVVLVPVVVGGGTPYLPSDVSLGLELLATTPFENGMVQLRYRVR